MSVQFGASLWWLIAYMHCIYSWKQGHFLEQAFEKGRTMVMVSQAEMGQAYPWEGARGGSMSGWEWCLWSDPRRPPPAVTAATPCSLGCCSSPSLGGGASSSQGIPPSRNTTVENREKQGELHVHVYRGTGGGKGNVDVHTILLRNVLTSSRTKASAVWYRYTVGFLLTQNGSQCPFRSIDRVKKEAS